MYNTHRRITFTFIECITHTEEEPLPSLRVLSRGRRTLAPSHMLFLTAWATPPFIWYTWGYYEGADVTITRDIMKEQMSPNRDNNWGLNLLTLAYDTPGARVVCDIKFYFETQMGTNEQKNV